MRRVPHPAICRRPAFRAGLLALAALAASPAGADGAAAPDPLAEADALFRAGSNALAAAAYRAFLAEGAATADLAARAIAGQASAAMRAGDLDAASTLFRRAAQTASPTNGLAAAYLALAADSLHRAGKFAEAAAAYADAAAAAKDGSPHKQDALFMAADSSERVGDAVKARDYYAAAAKAGGAREGEALLRLAAMQEREGGLQDAAAAYAALIRQAGGANPLGRRALLGLARTSCRAGRYGEALGSLEGTEDGGSGEAAYLRTIALFGLGRGAEARDAADAFLAGLATNDAARLPPFAADLRFWRAAYDYDAGDFAEAGRAFAGFAAENPAHPLAERAALLAGVAAFRMGDCAAAAGRFVALVKAWPTGALAPRARLLQAKALANLARFEDAVLVLDELVGRFPESPFATEAAVLRGDALRAASGGSDHFREAAASYAAALARGVAAPETRDYCARRLATCLAEAGDAAGARDALDELARRNPAEAAKAEAEIRGRAPRALSETPSKTERGGAK